MERRDRQSVGVRKLQCRWLAFPDEGRHRAVFHPVAGPVSRRRATRGPGDDPDGDRSANLLEFIFGTPPTAAGPPTDTPVTLSGGHVQITIPRRADRTAVLTVEVSGNLADWQSGRAATQIVDDEEAFLVVRDLTPLFPAIQGASCASKRKPPRHDWRGWQTAPRFRRASDRSGLRGPCHRGILTQSLSVVPADGGWRYRRLWRRTLRPSACVALGGGFRRAGHGVRGLGLSWIDGLVHDLVPPSHLAAARRCPRRGGLVCFRSSRSNRGILSLVYRRPSRRPCRGGRGCETLSGKPRSLGIRRVSSNRAGAALRSGSGQPSDRGDSGTRRRAIGSGGRGGQKSFLRRRAEVSP